MDLDDPFGGMGEPGGEEDLVDEAAAVGALEEIFGEEPPAPPTILGQTPTSPGPDTMTDPDEMMLGTRPKSQVLEWIQQQARSPSEAPSPAEAPAPSEPAAAPQTQESWSIESWARSQSEGAVAILAPGRTAALCPPPAEAAPSFHTRAPVRRQAKSKGGHEDCTHTSSRAMRDPRGHPWDCTHISPSVLPGAGEGP